MRAAQWSGRRSVSVVDLPVPVAAADQALVRVAYTGLCGSDLEEYLSGPVVARPPVVLGHEIVGVVAESARDGSGPAVGTPVVVDVVTGCGRCHWCRRHEEGLCPDLVVTGQHVDGGLAEYVVGRASRLVPVPSGLPLQHAALAEPAAVAVRAVRKLGPLLGCRAVVFGGGTIGLLVAQSLAHGGAAEVLVLEPSPARREIAAAVGVRSLWADDEAARAARLASHLPEPGVDVVVECSGATGVAREAIRLVRRGGRVVLLSVPPDDQPFDALDLVVQEKTVRGSAAHMWDEDVAVAVDLLASGALEVGPLISRVVPLESAPSAFESLVDPVQLLVKLLVGVGAAGPDDDPFDHRVGQPLAATGHTGQSGLG